MEKKYKISEQLWLFVYNENLHIYTLYVLYYQIFTCLFFYT